MTNNIFWFKKSGLAFQQLFVYKEHVFETNIYNFPSLENAVVSLDMPAVKKHTDFKAIKAFFLFGLFSKKKPNLVLKEEASFKGEGVKNRSGSLLLLLQKRFTYSFFYFFYFIFLPSMRLRQLTFSPSFDKLGLYFFL